MHMNFFWALRKELKKNSHGFEVLQNINVHTILEYLFIVVNFLTKN